MASTSCKWQCLAVLLALAVTSVAAARNEEAQPATAEGYEGYRGYDKGYERPYDKPYDKPIYVNPCPNPCPGNCPNNCPNVTCASPCGDCICNCNCTTCPGDTTFCFGECVDTNFNFLNCGQCGYRCPANSKCDGANGCVCDGDLQLCGDVNDFTTLFCADFKNPNTCGSCDNKCNSTQTCDGGQCVVNTCSPGQELCDGNCVDTNTDPANCGTCRTSCTNSCANGACCAGDGDNCQNPNDCCDGLTCNASGKKSPVHGLAPPAKKVCSPKNNPRQHKPAHKPSNKGL